MKRLKQEQSLNQTLTPQQILQANLFQLNSANLEQRILEELEKNPALELSDNESYLNENQSDDENDDKFEWDQDSLDNFDNSYSDNFNKKQLSVNDIPIKDELDFHDQLKEQLKDLNLSIQELEIAEELIGNIDGDGYLTIETILIADRLDINELMVIKVLKKIQKLDPPGIGSRNLRECLLSQIEKKEIDPMVWEILKNHFDDFANHKYQEIISNINCSESDLKNAMDTISSLNPKPGLGSDTLKNHNIIPDIIIDNSNNNWNININDNFLPELTVSVGYKKMLENQKEKKVKQFIKSKIESAYWFIDALKKRHQTLYLIIDAIIKRQESFFSDGKKLKPMILKDVANDINMDISTISRMTNGKYVQLSFGIYELKYFFSEGIKTDSGELVSNKTVKEILKTIIENEDKKNPYGDEKLSTILNQKGFKIARRTVTKYRESLKIPIGRLRKEL